MVAREVPKRGRRARVLARLNASDLERLERDGALPLRVTPASDATSRKIHAIPPEGPATSDPSLHEALQDLARTIVADIHEACGALDNPDIWYPGVDEGIEPVPDDHVELVIWALQRELDREPRPRGGPASRPAVPLAKLPWRIQRALVERRRLRYQEWGIGHEEWEMNRWHPDKVPEDPEWEPVLEER